MTLFLNFLQALADSGKLILSGLLYNNYLIDIEVKLVYPEVIGIRDAKLSSKVFWSPSTQKVEYVVISLFRPLHADSRFL